MERVFLSPAKLNLFLKVLRKRDDGYHEIISLVDIVSLYDLIWIREVEGDEITVRKIDGEMPEGQENTIFKAVRVLKEKFQIRRGLIIEVRKRIPIGAGLGGGSSNAATVIKALTKIWNLNISPEELLEIGTSIGADVPLFLYGRPCIIRGIGEKVYPCKLPTLWYVIVHPGVEISTKEVYQRCKIVLTKDENDIKLWNNLNSVDDIVRVLENDLEETAQTLCPQIKAIKEVLIHRGAKGALMSGSGSSVFGCFESRESAERAAKYLLPYGKVFVARSI